MILTNIANIKWSAASLAITSYQINVDADVAVVVILQKRQSLSNDVLAIPDSGAIVTPIDPICSYTRVQAQLPSAKDHVIRGSRRRYAGRVKTRAKMYGFRARRTIRERADCHEIRYCRRRRRRRRKRGNDCRSCTREIVLAMA